MKCFLVFLTALFFLVPVRAQTAVDSVKNVINKLFEGIKKSDAAIVVSCFTDSAILQTITKNKEGNTVLLTESTAAFANTVSNLKAGDADEKIVFDIVKIDAELASVWAPYNFYFKTVFSHCGVNSFQLVKINGEWKIQYLIDTRRKKGCI